MLSFLLMTDLIRHSLVSSAIATTPRTGFAVLDTLMLTLLPLLLCWITTEMFKKGKSYFNDIYAYFFPPPVVDSGYKFVWTIHSTNEGCNNAQGENDEANFFRVRKQMHQNTAAGSHHNLIINGILNELCAVGAVNQSQRQTVALIPPEQWKSTREKYLNLQTVMFPTAPVEYEDMQFIYSVDTAVKDEKKEGDGSGVSNPNKLNCSLTILFNDHDKVKKFTDKCKAAEIDRVVPPEKEEVVKQRHMYILRDAKSLVFARIPFNTNKTFNSIFFSQKKQAMKLIEDFQQRAGSWDVRLERTHKLVILLHGRPGAGKTSTIKALAKHLDRDVFSINPGVCTSDADLFHVMHDKQIYLSDKRYGNTYLSTVAQNKRLVVMEDLDCAGCDWLLHRDADKLVKQGAWQTRVIIDGESIDPSAINNDKDKASASKDKDNTDDNNKVVMEGAGPQVSTYRTQTTTFSGFLNVLDGLAELDGLVIVITTNNLEKFDPAFIRPGRVDIMIELDSIAAEEARDMLNFRYHPNVVSAEQFERLKLITSVHEVAPCKLEECCQYASDAESAIVYLQKTQEKKPSEVVVNAMSATTTLSTTCVEHVTAVSA